MLCDSTRFAISICPECNDILKEKLNIFKISARKGHKSLCSQADCLCPIWEMKEAKDKYRITVRCPACEEHHTYTMSKRNFWSKKYFAFKCPTWEVKVIHFGDDKEYLESQLDACDEGISRVLSEFFNYDESFNLMYDLIECINDIAKEDRVECSCGKTDITIVIDEDKVVLSCRNCGKTKTILPTEDNINLLSQTGTIVLDNTILN